MIRHFNNSIKNLTGLFQSISKQILFGLIFSSLTLSACSQPAGTESGTQSIGEYLSGKDNDKYSVAVFAGGCFWCTEAAFERIQGVVDVISGYSGGDEPRPTYEDLWRQKTTHAEAIYIVYDPEKVSFQTLLQVFFVAHDPTQLNRQGPDVGPQYRSGIFYRSEEQKHQAETAIRELDSSGKFNKPIVTELSAYKEFWVAESYHQDYYEHHPGEPYILQVSRPKVKKVEKTFADILKAPYRN